MIITNRSSLHPVQDSMHVSDNEKKTDGAVDSSACSSAVQTVLGSGLSGVKNVGTSFDNINLNKELPSVSDNQLFRKEFLKVNVLSPDALAESRNHRKNASHTIPSTISHDRSLAVSQQCIDHIVEKILPDIDSSYQVALTTYENIKSLDPLVSGAAKEALVDIENEKKALQDEVLGLYQQCENIKDSLGQGQHASGSQYLIFSLIFKISFSFNDVERLLDHVSLKDSFFEFAHADENQPAVIALYAMLNKNCTQSLESEMTHFMG